MNPLEHQGASAIILFDGVCNLCNAAVTFVIDRDPEAHFRFAPLQSELGRQLLARYGVRQGALESLVLLEPSGCYTHSAAALRVARRLKGPWPLLYGLILVPKPLRDRAYTWVANNRYGWFGKTEACRLPTPELRRRFLSLGDASSPTQAVTVLEGASGL